MKSEIFSLPLLAVAIVLASEVELIDVQNTEPCTVQAWVHAEDFSPDHISRGELRSKVLRKECANQTASMALRLQLDEFNEVRFLKRSAILFEVRVSNETVLIGLADWTASDVLYDYRAHDDGANDPALRNAKQKYELGRLSRLSWKIIPT
ncbi:hypothetical protein K438DRAFT_402651 [Mycena galopus ATCC 62051]|nr:hypothetical protein K438DRAFT_402651 [Mycena galopus ATCC 62051]